MQAYHLLNKKVGHILSQDEKKMGGDKKKKSKVCIGKWEMAPTVNAVSGWQLLL